MPKNMSETVRDKPAAGSDRPFPQHVKPAGGRRFGPPPRPERKTEQNVFNTDRHGTKRPGEK